MMHMPPLGAGLGNRRGFARAFSLLVLFGSLGAAVPPDQEPVSLQAWPARDLVITGGSGARRPLFTEEALLKAAASAAKTGPGAAVVVDYPLPATLFPPDMVAPTFLFHDPAPGAKRW